jgi:hypothetical protein
MNKKMIYFVERDFNAIFNTFPDTYTQNQSTFCPLIIYVSPV